MGRNFWGLNDTQAQTRWGRVYTGVLKGLFILVFGALGLLGPFVLTDGAQAVLMGFFGVGGYSGTLTVDYCEPTRSGQLCHGAFRPDGDVSQDTRAQFLGEDYALQSGSNDYEDGDKVPAHLWSPDSANAYASGSIIGAIPLSLGSCLVCMDIWVVISLLTWVVIKIARSSSRRSVRKRYLDRHGG